jgi:DNA polymerase III alpha subunit (gram-positive type)
MNPYRSYSDSPYLLFNDVETTGFDYLRNDVIVWSGVVTDLELNVLAKKTIKIKPYSQKFYGAEKIHGISYQEAFHFMPLRQAVFEIFAFLKPFKTDDPLTFVEHSLNYFDFHMNVGMFLKEDLLFPMRKFIQQKHSISTIDIAKDCGYKNNKLNEWAVKIGFNLKHHDAESDVLCTVELLKYLRRQAI